jgi:ferric-dicitrate binding protein FerR (iron transport regulator)/TolA-binding protein
MDEGRLCDRVVDRLPDVLSEGGAPDDEVARLRAHAERCPACAEALAHWAALSATMEEGDDDLLGELAERRIERAAIEALDRASLPPAAARPRGLRPLVAGAGILLAAGLAALGLWPRGPQPLPRADRGASVLLASRGARIGGGLARAADPLFAGARVEVPDDARLGVSLPDGSSVWFGPGARGRIASWKADDVRIRLDAGTVVAKVVPDPRRRFVVGTADLEARVRGTVFSVSAGAPSVVRVLRGVVDVVDRGASTDAREVAAGEAAIGGDGGVGAADAADVAADWALAGRREQGPDGARLLVESTPPGATVSLDGEPVGRTPVSWIARPGYGRLEALLDGHAPIVEEVDLRAGDVVERRYTLTVAATDAGPPETDEEGDEGLRVARRAPHGATGGTTAAPDPGPVLDPVADLVAAGRLDEARAALSGASADSHWRVADAMRAARRYRDALAVYRSIRIGFPGTTSAHNARFAEGRLLLDRLGDPRGAAEAFDGYLAQAPGGALAAEAMLGKARAAWALGDHAGVERSVRAYLDAHGSAARAAEAAVLLGDSLRARSSWRAAADAYRTAISRGARGRVAEDAWYGAVESLARAGDRAGAGAAAREYLTRFPEGRWAERARTFAGR